MLCDILLDNVKTKNNNKPDGYKFYIESGRKYYKIIMETGAGSRSAHAIVDKQTVDVYKPASFKSPAKHVRSDLCLLSYREWLFAHADCAGSYLYM